MKKKFLTFILSICFIIPCMFMLSACNTTPAKTEFKVENGYIQYYDGENWNNLIAVEELKGEDGVGVDGKEVEFRKTSTHIQWRYVDASQGANANWTNLVALSEIRGDEGTDGKEVEFRKTSTHIQWRYVDASQDANANWTNLVALSEIQGDEGTDGKEVEFRKTSTHIQWRYIIANQSAEEGWTNLISIEELNGEDATYSTYTIIYDYNFPYQMDLLFDNYKETQNIKSTEWLTSLPTIKANNLEAFDGWYIKDTNKKIENYDFIGGNVTLVARWNTTPEVPSGLYQNGVYVKTWEELKSTYSIFKNDTISGYSYSTGPSGDLVIDDSILSIGEYAFSNDDLKSVLISKNVASIASVAFDKCENLEAVYFGTDSKLETIGMGAFEYCKSLKQIEIPASVKTIGMGAFDSCEQLSEIKLNEGLESIASIAFGDCTNLVSIDIPSSVNTIGFNAFSGCIKLENIFVDNANQTYSDDNGVLFDKNKETLITYPVNHSGDNYTVPSSTTTIEEQAFTNCSGLRSISMQTGLTTIKSYAFSHCSSLRQVSISDTISTVDNTAFIDCSNIYNFFVDDNNNNFSDAAIGGSTSTSLLNKDKTTLIFAAKSDVKTVSIPNTVTTINKYAFSTCGDLVSLTIGALVGNIDTQTFTYCPNLQTINVNESNPNYASNGNCLTSKDGKTLMWGGANFSIPNTVTQIANNAFLGCEGLTNIVIPDSVITIGENAFKDCVNLSTVTIGEGVKNINKFAFYNCTALNTIYFNAIKCNNITYDYAIFGKCAENATLIFGNKVTYIPAYLLEDNGRVTNITFGTEVKSIGEMAFHGCDFTTITLPEKLETIGANAFSECIWLTKIIIPNSVKTIDGRAFADCNRLKEVAIGIGVTSIGGTAFEDVNLNVMYFNATSCSAPSTSACIFKSATIKKLVIGDNVTSIPNYMFYTNTGFAADKLEIEEIVFGANLASVGSNWFLGTGLKTIVINNSYVLTNISLKPATIYINSALQITTFEGYTLQQTSDRENFDMWIKSI